jgi:hypothetical protein
MPFTVYFAMGLPTNRVDLHSGPGSAPLDSASITRGIDEALTLATAGAASSNRPDAPRQHVFSGITLRWPGGGDVGGSVGPEMRDGGLRSVSGAGKTFGAGSGSPSTESVAVPPSTGESVL